MDAKSRDQEQVEDGGRGAGIPAGASGPPSLDEVTNLIHMVDVDFEICNMLDAFYVNDQPELQFLSESKPLGASTGSPSKKNFGFVTGVEGVRQVNGIRQVGTPEETDKVQADRRLAAEQYRLG